VSGLPITQCSGEQVLREIVHELGFDDDADRIVDSSVCIPCLLPHAGSVWLTRKRKDRPKVVPDGAKNFAFLGQFAEVPKDTMFTMEYSVRTVEAAGGATGGAKSPFSRRALPLREIARPAAPKVH
jgi:oleate hydratase